MLKNPSNVPNLDEDFPLAAEPAPVTKAPAPDVFFVAYPNGIAGDDDEPKDTGPFVSTPKSRAAAELAMHQGYGPEGRYGPSYD